MCLRDATGGFLKAKVMSYSPLLQVCEGEALGLLEAAKWVLELGLDNVIFEVDSKLVFDSFHSTSLDFSYFRAIMSHIKNFVNSSFLKLSHRVF